MKNIIVIGDIHNHTVEAEEIASLYDKTHKVIFIGDYFDDFGDTAYDAINTAKWLKNSLAKPNRIHLMGNHDINYSYLNFVKDSSGNLQNLYNCSGYDPNKDFAINSIMSEEDWDKIKFAHFENGFWFAHGGFHRHWFEHPIKGIHNEYIMEKINNAESDYKSRTWTEIIGAVGRCRGGSQRVGGLLWLDDYRESEVIPNFKQVCGHTPTMNKISINYDPDIKGGLNINVDCGLCQVLEIGEDGSYDAIETGFPNFYLAAREKQAKKFKAAVDKMNIGAYDDIYKKL
jgi:hypothetical protein